MSQHRPDPEMVGEVLDVMKDLASNDMTMVVVTHEMDSLGRWAQEFCSWTRKILEENTPAGIL